MNIACNRISKKAGRNQKLLDLLRIKLNGLAQQAGVFK